MNTTLIYLLQVNVGIVLFYLFYRLFFAGDTFWKTRRIYLMLSCVASFTYPLLSIESWLSQPQPMQTALVRITTLPEIVVSPVQQPEFISIESLLLGVYLLVVAVLFGRMLLQLLLLLRLRWAGAFTNLQGATVIAVDRELSPFSFFGAVFINPRLHTEAETQQILAHELTHVRQRHSIDVLVGELLSIAFWINPAVWLLKREIRQNLEFLADHQVLRSGFDTKNYQYHLLQLTYYTPDLKLGNQFNVSPLKKRIMMMNKQKTNKAAVLKYLLIVPLVLSLVLVANAQSVVKKTKKVVAPTSDRSVSAKPDSLKVKIKRTSKFNAPVMRMDSTVKMNGQEVFEIVEKMPVYPGGVSELMNYLARNIRYPQAAQKAKVEGKVFVSFVVNKEGHVQSPKIVRGVAANRRTVTTDQVVVVGYGSDAVSTTSSDAYKVGAQAIDEEAIRVVNSMPQWTPGEQKGQKVAVRYVLPIQFKLDDGATDKNETQAAASKSGIRCVSTTPSSNEKLYIIDGISASKEQVDALNPDKIKEINVLKDASATAIYGARGANGVVVIITKK